MSLNLMFNPNEEPDVMFHLMCIECGNWWLGLAYEDNVRYECPKCNIAYSGMILKIPAS